MKSLAILRNLACLAVLSFTTTILRAGTTSEKLRAITYRASAGKTSRGGYFGGARNAPNAHDNVIIASNFGSLGKKADEDDLGVPQDRPTQNGGREEGRPLQRGVAITDVSGDTIGVLAVAFPYKMATTRRSF